MPGRREFANQQAPAGIASTVLAVEQTDRDAELVHSDPRPAAVRIDRRQVSYPGGVE
jgi:hypothetical protein